MWGNKRTRNSMPDSTEVYDNIETSHLLLTAPTNRSESLVSILSHTSVESRVRISRALIRPDVLINI